MHHQYGISALVTLLIILRGKQWWYALFWILRFLDPYLHIRLQAQVVEKLDNDIQWINHYPENKAIIVLIQQIVIYLVDSVIQPLNNWVLRILNQPFIWESYCSTYQEQQGWGGDGDIFVVVVLSWKKCLPITSWFSLCLQTESLKKPGNWTDFQCKLWVIYSQLQPQVTWILLYRYNTRRRLNLIFCEIYRFQTRRFLRTALISQTKLMSLAQKQAL